MGDADGDTGEFGPGDWAWVRAAFLVRCTGKIGYG